MFILNRKKDIAMTAGEIVAIKHYLSCANVKLNGATIIRNTVLTWNTGVAFFSMLHPDIIFICHDQRNLKRMAPHVAHELKHREQYKRMGAARYAMLSVPLLRRWTIEPEAYAEEDRVALILG